MQTTKKVSLWWTVQGSVVDLNSDWGMTVDSGDIDMTSQGWVLLGESEAVFEIKDLSKVTEQQVAFIDESIKRVQAAVEEKLTELRAVRNSLLALTNEVKPTIRPSSGFEDLDDDIPF